MQTVYVLNLTNRITLNVQRNTLEMTFDFVFLSCSVSLFAEFALKLGVLLMGTGKKAHDGFSYSWCRL